MKLTTAAVINKTAGDYTFNVSMSSGTSLFEYSLDNGAWVDVDDSALTASGNGIIKLSSCRFRWTGTGDAEAWLNKVK